LKKTAAISLITLLLFNWIGYCLLSTYFENRATDRLETSLDRQDFDPSQVLTIRIPANHFAYYNSSLQFERVNGTIEISGIQYNYVGKRLYNDSLEFLCIPNQEVMKLQAAREEFFRVVNDLQHDGQGRKSDSHSRNSKNFLSVYTFDHPGFELPTLAGREDMLTEPGSATLIPGFGDIPELPPKA
jgi:hypothetical protein